METIDIINQYYDFYEEQSGRTLGCLGLALFLDC